MAIAIKMPALSPTMEEGTLARWLVKEGDSVSAGDIMAEIETDKATMEFEAVDEGVIASIAVAEGTENVKVGTVIAMLAEDGEDVGEAASAAPAEDAATAPAETAQPAPSSKSGAPAGDDTRASPLARRMAQQAGLDLSTISGSGPGGRVVKADVEQAGTGGGSTVGAAPVIDGDRIIASPLARKLAGEQGIDLATVAGSGPNGRIVKNDIDSYEAPKEAPVTPAAQPAAAAPAADVSPDTAKLLDARIPHTISKLSGMRKTIARRLAQSMQEAPHIYLSLDVRLDRLLAVRAEMNHALEKQRVKLSVNDMLIKALGKALVDVPECNVTFAGNEMIHYSRADISVAVSIPNGLITPIVQDADGRSLSSIAKAMKDLGARAKEGKLAPEEYQGGTASISNMGMMGIKHFTAVINPPQSTILAVGAGEKRPWVMPDDSLGVATVMTATGSFDHRAVDGADGARLMAAFREYVESPLGMVA
ncbi:MAG: 2-oxo acid dehydrogenase subunit E2 [Sphingomonadaceae bacterium]|nr:2-oxo acid dehydrogenase subunit E2 [Sphingomonadaceae bacterium]